MGVLHGGLDGLVPGSVGNGAQVHAVLDHPDHECVPQVVVGEVLETGDQRQLFVRGATSRDVVRESNLARGADVRTPGYMSR